MLASFIVLVLSIVQHSFRLTTITIIDVTCKRIFALSLKKTVQRFNLRFIKNPIVIPRKLGTVADIETRQPPPKCQSNECVAAGQMATTLVAGMCFTLVLSGYCMYLIEEYRIIMPSFLQMWMVSWIFS